MLFAKVSIVILTCAGALTGCGKPAPEPAPPVAGVAPAVTADLPHLPPVVPQAVPPVAPELVAGKRVFDKTCGLCHGAGVGGAPRPGDKANWAPRIAQGMDTLYRHAIEGYNGASGYMPARGGTATGDGDVKAGVDYMVAVSR